MAFLLNSLQSSVARPEGAYPATVREGGNVRVYRLFIATLIFAPLAFGAVETWSMAIMEAGVFTALLILLLREARNDDPTLRRTPGSTIYLLFLLFIALQLLPLPQGLLGFLSPRALTIYGEVGADGGGRWLSLSLNRKATLAELFRFASYGAAYYLAVQLLVSRRRLKRTVHILVVFVSLFTLLAILQQLLPGDFLFSLRHVPDRHKAFGTYLNRNHYAGLMEMIFPVVFAIFLLERPQVAREAVWSRLAGVFTAPGSSQHVMLGFSAVLMASSVILCLSRGGMIAVAVSLAALCLLLLWRGREQRGRLVGLGAAALVVIYVGWFGWQPVFERFGRAFGNEGQINLLRISLWRDMSAMVSDFAAAGSGLGTLTDVYPAYRSAPGTDILQHAHNDYLEMWATAGTVGSLLLAAFIAAVLTGAFRSFLRRQRSYAIYLFTGCFAGIVAFLFHGFFDFNLQVGANGLFFFFFLGLAVAAANSRGHEAGGGTYLPAARLPGKGLPAAVCVFLLLGGTILFHGGVVAAGLASLPSAAATLDPMEADYRRLLAEELWRDGDLPGALTAVGRSVELAPTRSETLQRRGMLLAAAGKTDAARRFFAAGVRFDATNPRRHEIYGSWLLSRGQVEKGIGAYRDALGFEPAKVKEYVTTMILYGLSDDEIAQAMPDESEALLGFAEYLESTENLEGARLAFRRALDAALAEKGPRADYFYRVSQFYRRAGLDDQALGVLREGIAAGVESALLHIEAAALYEKELNYSRAMEEYQAALLIDPGHGRARSGIARVSSRLP